MASFIIAQCGGYYGHATGPGKPKSLGDSPDWGKRHRCKSLRFPVFLEFPRNFGQGVAASGELARIA